MGIFTAIRVAPVVVWWWAAAPPCPEKADEVPRWTYQSQSECVSQGSEAREWDDQGEIRTSEKFDKLPIFLRDEAAIYGNADTKAIDLPWKEIMGIRSNPSPPEMSAEVSPSSHSSSKSRFRKSFHSLWRGVPDSEPVLWWSGGESPKATSPTNHQEPSDRSDDDEGPKVKKRKASSWLLSVYILFYRIYPNCCTFLFCLSCLPHGLLVGIWQYTLSTARWLCHSSMNRVVIGPWLTPYPLCNFCAQFTMAGA